MSDWTLNDIPDQTDKIVIVTGANSGLGLDTTAALAQKGAHVIMACRDTTRGQSALDSIRADVPHARLELMTLDLASLASIAAFVESFTRHYTRLDLLINNAGVMGLPRSTTVDGFETQLGINHLGHFALTARLISLLVKTPASRIVNVSSMANWMGRLNFDDLMGERSYSRYGAYCQSKLANVVFANELQRRLEKARADTISNTAHPGLVMTNLQANATHASGSTLERINYQILGKLIAQPSELGVRHQLYAATAPTAKGGEFYGPGIFGGRRIPNTVRPHKAALDPEIGARLWKVSEELTGVEFTIPKQG